MSDMNKNPNFLFCGSDKKKIVNKIDEIKYLNLHNGGGKDVSTSRIDLFLFAMALGMDTIPTEVKHQESFIREEYIKTKHDAFFYSAFIYRMKDKSNLDCIVNKDKVYKLAQEYANTGFDVIDNMMNSKPSSVAELELIKELDAENERYFGKE